MRNLIFKGVFLCPVILLFLTLACADAARIDDNYEVDRPDSRYEVVINRVDSEKATFRVVRVTGGLANPWGLAFLPDGRKLVNEREGRLHLVEDGQTTAVTNLPDIRDHGQGGFLDITLHPDYGRNGWIYFVYAGPTGAGVGTHLSRARLDGTSLTDYERLYTLEPKTNARVHFGSRINFLDDGTLLFTIGDRGNGPRAQDLRDAAGSTIRLNDDGSIPQDNPFVGREDALPELYTVGNRNSQGMAIHPQTGDVWQTEHGPRGGDELNLIRPGANYGWPEASWGRDYRTGEQIGVPHDQAEDYEEPVEYWVPAIAPSGLVFYEGDAFPQWQNHLFAGSLVQRKLIRIELDGHDVTHQEYLLQGQIGRIRDVLNGPDGYIYILTDEGDGGIYRLEPVN
jgi:aldose sugar dehydrogenase